MNFVTSNISDEVYKDIKKRIIEVEFYPGEKLSENKLASYYNVSRTPIKNALTRLEGENLITTISQQGSFVTKLSINKIRELLTIRCYLEVSIITNELITDSSCLPLLEENIRKQKNLLSRSIDIKDRVKKFNELDNEMHKLIFKAYSRESLWEYIVNSSPQLQMYRVLSTIRENEFYNDKIVEHEAICKKIIKGEINNISELYKEHILSSDSDVIINVVNMFPSYFID